MEFNIGDRLFLTYKEKAKSAWYAAKIAKVSSRRADEDECIVKVRWESDGSSSSHTLLRTNEVRNVVDLAKTRLVNTHPLWRRYAAALQAADLKAADLKAVSRGHKKRSNKDIEDEPSLVVPASTAVTPRLTESRRTPHKDVCNLPTSSVSRDSGVHDHLSLASASAADLTRRPKLNVSTLLGISLYFPMHIPLQNRATHDIGHDSDAYADADDDGGSGILNLRGMPLGNGGHFRIPRQMSKIFENLDGLPANDLNVQLSKISQRIEKNFMFAVPQYLKYFQARLGSEGMTTVFAVDLGENPEERGCQLMMSVDMIRYSHFVTTKQFGIPQNTADTWSAHLKALYSQACLGHS